jgi:ADP-dependent NAD(P)H-hydrate dehydratase
VVVAGTRETPGAGLLAAEGALRVGAGKIHLATASSCAATLAVAVPELMVTGLAEDDGGSLHPDGADELVECVDGCTVLLGPGFTDPDVSDALVRRLVPRLGGTVVLDALATAYVTDNHDEVAALDATVVLTVNPGELAQCLGVAEDAVAGDLESHTVRLAARTRAVVVCGGAVKVVAHRDDLWRVEAGNAGLGTAGSGDVQAGVVAGLLARGADPAQAAVWGAFLHATAGDRLAERVGPVGFVARELPGELPGLLADLAD